MSKKLPKEEQHYQLSKEYSFRDLELSLMVKRDEVETLKKEIKRLTELNAGLRYDIKKYEKIFDDEKQDDPLQEFRKLQGITGDVLTSVRNAKGKE